MLTITHNRRTYTAQYVAMTEAFGSRARCCVAPKGLGRYAAFTAIDG